ncbi:exosporium protein G [Streptomyces sp. cmx-4-9]
MQVNCVAQEGNSYFLNQYVGDLLVVHTPITEGGAALFLALGIPRCS